MSKNHKSVLLFGLLVICSSLLNAQNFEEFNTYKSKYPDARFVRLNNEIEISISVEEDQLYIEKAAQKEDLYLDDTAKSFSDSSLSYSTFFELRDIEASSLLYEDGKLTEYPIEEFKESDEASDVFYDDTKTLNFIYPGLKEGAKSRLRYKQIIKNPRFLGAFYLGDFYPISKGTFKLVVDKDIEMDFKLFNADTIKVDFSKKERRKTIEYTWQVQDIDEYDYEANAPNYREVLPHVVPIIRSYKSNGKTIKVLGELGDLYSWYASLVQEVNTQEPSPELKAIVDEITAGLTTDLEKVKAIFYWAQQNIKYVAFEYALGGFVPREANEVFNKKYGDCKDNSSIMDEMMEIANIKGDLTWIGTREIPYSYTELPTPAVDNHMILSYTENGKTYFLDATGRYTPFGFPTSFIQGKEALIADGDNYRLVEVPVIEAAANAVIDSTRLSIVDKKIIGQSKTVFSGYVKGDLFESLDNLSSAKNLNEYYNNRLTKGNNSFLVDEVVENNKFDYDKDFELTYKFEVTDHHKSLKDEIYINLNLSQLLSDFVEKEDRKYPFEMDYKRAIKFVNILEVPQGYTVDYIPENVSAANDFMSFEITHEVKGQEIIYTHSATLDFLTINTDQLKEARAVIKAAQKAYRDIVVLKKI
ncbi:DUF3857 domain-containing protein [Gilvibacter sp.]|uniref:DUF3857 domain-containing protein n=1 Tax=Gilvibacter sp. TaxID=2729997 RepID=UPI0035BE3CF9